MKALIRNEGETVYENSPHKYIDWNTGYPLTNPKWFGGPYTLVQNYVPPKDDEPAQYEEVIIEPEPPVEENEDDYIVINGVRYSKEELRSMLE